MAANRREVMRLASSGSLGQLRIPQVYCTPGYAVHLEAQVFPSSNTEVELVVYKTDVNHVNPDLNNAQPSDITRFRRDLAENFERAISELLGAHANQEADANEAAPQEANGNATASQEAEGATLDRHLNAEPLPRYGDDDAPPSYSRIDLQGDNVRPDNLAHGIDRVASRRRQFSSHRGQDSPRAQRNALRQERAIFASQRSVEARRANPSRGFVFKGDKNKFRAKTVVTDPVVKDNMTPTHTVRGGRR